MSSRARQWRHLQLLERAELAFLDDAVGGELNQRERQHDNDQPGDDEVRRLQLGVVPGPRAHIDRHHAGVVQSAVRPSVCIDIPLVMPRRIDIA